VRPGADHLCAAAARRGNLREHDFHLVILDESHYIKNTRSKAAQSAGLLRARHRLCLSGTPLENHLGELWSQFHFLLPGLLGDEKTFNTSSAIRSSARTTRCAACC
jgi:SNF2 family DNA or RNA helicase